MTFDIDKFLKEGESFFAKLVTELRLEKIDIRPESADHLCFRVNSPDEYTFYKSELLQYAKLLTEALVNGRPICTFKLVNGFKFENHSIDLLELPFPKMGSAYETGFEHAEFVLNESFTIFQNRHHTVEFKVSGNKNLNPELCLKTKSGQAKFHYSPLNRVIEIEEAKIQNVILGSGFDLNFGSSVKVHKLDSYDHTRMKPQTTILIGSTPKEMRKAKDLNIIAAAALWNNPADLNDLIQHGAEIFFFEPFEFTKYVNKQS